MPHDVDARYPMPQHKLMIQLTQADGKPVAVNPNVIATVQPSDDGTLITLSSGKAFDVRESFAAVSKALGTTAIEDEAGPVGFAVSGWGKSARA